MGSAKKKEKRTHLITTYKERESVKSSWGGSAFCRKLQIGGCVPKRSTDETMFDHTDKSESMQLLQQAVGSVRFVQALSSARCKMLNTRTLKC